MKEYVYKENKKLRCGYTTGTCAQAGAKAAAIMLFSGEIIEKVSVTTPKGSSLVLDVKEPVISEDTVTCAIQKDSGDDFDVTNGIYVYATVKKTDGAGIVIDGGLGVGRVTRKGLDQEIGQAAINSVPRKMIKEAVLSICEEVQYTGGLQVILSIPQGMELAKKTFNPRLGIEGGISILGTSGIVEPMSEAALVDTIRTEVSMLTAAGYKFLIASPGNFGEAFIQNTLGLDMERTVKCSNFIGETIDMAFEFGVEGLLLTGHIGKLVKLGAGIMNTHSKMADGRMETLVSCTLLAGGDTDLLKQVLNSGTTDEALDILAEAQLLKSTMQVLTDKIEAHLKYRAYEGLIIGAVLFSNKHGFLGKTTQADYLMERLR